MDSSQALTVSKTTHLIPVDQIERMAQAFAKSGLFGIKTPEQGIALMLIAQAEGMHPAIAARDFHIVQNRPALKADAMLARFQAAGGKVSWGAYTDTEVTGTFSHPQGGSVTLTWTIAQAKAAGLANKDVWKQYPRAMLRARVISEGIRTVYPGVSVGVYTPEEITDMDEKPSLKTVEAHTVVTQHEPHERVASHSDVREAAIKTLGSGRWSKPQLVKYCEATFGVSASKDLTEKQLIEFASVVESMDYETAVTRFMDEVL